MELRRLLSEKATLLEEVELISGQKDALTEALVKANHQLAESSRCEEELALFKAQHAEGAERLQAALAEGAAALRWWGEGQGGVRRGAAARGAAEIEGADQVRAALLLCQMRARHLIMSPARSCSSIISFAISFRDGQILQGMLH